jgi:hypothetical protein
MEMKKFENATTTVRAMHMTMVTRKLVVTARAEQMPNICSVMGFSATTGLNNNVFVSVAISTPSFSLHSIW